MSRKSLNIKKSKTFNRKSWEEIRFYQKVLQFKKDLIFPFKFTIFIQDVLESFFKTSINLIQDILKNIFHHFF